VRARGLCSWVGDVNIVGTMLRCWGGDADVEIIMIVTCSTGPMTSRGFPMRSGLVATVVIPFVLLNGGCSRESDKAKAATEKTRAAIERVLKADDKLAKEREKNLPPKANPSQIGWSIGVYCDGLERLEMSDCPADFRVAYRQHIRAWRDAEAAVKKMPDSFLEGVFVGIWNSALRGEADGGTSRLEGDLKRATERVRTTWEEVERTGAKYGAAL
jgi:hypothetical protein